MLDARGDSTMEQGYDWKGELLVMAIIFPPPIIGTEIFGRDSWWPPLMWIASWFVAAWAADKRRSRA